MNMHVDIMLFLWVAFVMGIGFALGWYCRKKAMETRCRECRAAWRSQRGYKTTYTTPQKIKDDPTGDFVPEKQLKEFGD